MVFNEEGCKTLKEIGLLDAKTIRKRCKLDKVTVLSKLGSQYYLGVKIGKGSQFRFPMNSTSVKSWSSLQKEKE